jgi:hypothetical protein
MVIRVSLVTVYPIDDSIKTTVKPYEIKTLNTTIAAPYPVIDLEIFDHSFSSGTNNDKSKL